MVNKKEAPVGASLVLALVSGAAKVVSAHHTLNTSLGVDDSLFAGPERVALAADFSPQAFLRGPYFPGVTTCASNNCVLVVSGVNVGFHIFDLPD